MNEVHLQDDLDMIYLWAVENNMEFNSKKFQANRFAEMCVKVTVIKIFLKNSSNDKMKVGRNVELIYPNT